MVSWLGTQPYTAGRVTGQAMRALTVLQPWATFLATGEKPVENRSWPPPTALIGQRMAIHAGKRFEVKLAEVAFDLAGRTIDREELALGAIVATARLARVVRDAGVAVRGRQGIWALPVTMGRRLACV